MCTTEQTFAWVGAIVVNVAFISIIAWGASTIWYVGFIISAVYTAILFALARAVDKKSAWDAVAPTDDEISDDRSTSSQSLHIETGVAVPPRHKVFSRSIVAERRMPVLANLLYGLFALALGVTGYFLPMNIFSCDLRSGSAPYASDGTWSTDNSALPVDVRTWASSTQPSVSALATFIYILGEEQNSTLFAATDGNHPQTLWLTMGADPINFPEVQDPSSFTATGTGWACFAGINVMASSDYNHQQTPIDSLVGCSDGKAVMTTINATTYTFQGPYDFFVDTNHTLWFKDYPPYYGDQIETGTLIYSIDDYNTMDVKLHSTLSTSRNPAADDVDDCWTKQSIVAIFVSAIPITLASVLLWVKRNAPSMAITSYIGLSTGAFLLYLASVGQTYGIENFWWWWLSISGALYVVILSDLSYCERQISHGPLIWGINFGALAFLLGMIFLTGIFELLGAWPWVAFNALALVPLGIVGLGHNLVFLLVLCALGWLMTTVKIASAISAAISAAEVPIYFIVLAIGGLLIAAAGWSLNKHQDQIQGFLFHHMEKICFSRRFFPSVESDQHPNTAEQIGENDLREISTL
eukprot:CCRYP_014900-RA/>CCRYP_014900-RA protein AED:0.22 eAED:0.22 QI:0/-1/0/1/-1/1/1/0/581